jgi:hypothetical protein
MITKIKFSGEECGKKAMELSGGTLKAEKLDRWANGAGLAKIAKVKSGIDAGMVDDAAKTIYREFEKEEMAVLKREHQAQVHAVKTAQNINKAAVWDSQFKNEVDYLINWTVGTQQNVVGNRSSVSAKKIALEMDYQNKVISILDKHGIKEAMQAFNNEADEIKLGRAIEKADYEYHGADWSTKPYAKEPIDEAYLKAGQEIQKLRSGWIDYNNTQGGFITKMQGYVASMHYNPNRMRYAHDKGSIGLSEKILGKFKGKDYVEAERLKAKNTFIDEMHPLIDWVETRNKVEYGNMPEFNEREFLGSVWESRVTQVDLSTDVTGTGVSNASIGDSPMRMIMFKDADSYHKANRNYGSGSLMQTILQDARSFASDSALLQELGPKPEQGYNEVVRYLQEQKDPKTGLGRRTTMTDVDGYAMQSYKNFMLGHKELADMTWASLGRMIRGYQAAVKLPGAGLTSAILDSAQAFAGLARHGIIDPYMPMRGLWAFLGGKNDVELQRIGKLLSLGNEAFLGRVHAASMGNGVDGAMGRFVNLSMNINRLAPVTDNTKVAVGAMTSAHLGSLHTKSFGELEDAIQNLLTRYDINQHEWDVIRSLPTDIEGHSGLKAIHGDIVFDEKITDEQIRNMMKASKYATTNTNEARHIVATKFSNMFIDFSNTLISTPDSRIRSLMEGMRAGTVFGELVQSMMLFKGFALGFGYNIVMGAGRMDGAKVQVSECCITNLKRH